jgi:hypothetical protein
LQFPKCCRTAVLRSQLLLLVLLGLPLLGQLQQLLLPARHSWKLPRHSTAPALRNQLLLQLLLLLELVVLLLGWLQQHLLLPPEGYSLQLPKCCQIAATRQQVGRQMLGLLLPLVWGSQLLLELQLVRSCWDPTGPTSPHAELTLCWGCLPAQLPDLLLLLLLSQALQWLRCLPQERYHLAQ